MTDLQPNFADVQSHYDVSDAFYALFLDESMTYSCAYFERDDMSLREAQMAKIDLSLGKLGLHEGMRLLDIGCGWGATLRRAIDRFGVRGVGLTLSRNQCEHVSKSFAKYPAGAAEVRLEGWEQFSEPVDRIVSIGAFEHFRIARFRAFFERCRAMLPDDGVMLLHTIVQPDLATLRSQGIAFSHEDVLFGKFIAQHIFPGGQLAAPAVITQHAADAGFRVERIQSLQPHYARTLAIWAKSLEAKRDEAVALTSLAVYDTYMKYLTGCSRYFGSGHIDVMQFTLAAS